MLTRGNVEVRSLREDLELRNEVSVRPKNRAEGGRSKNGIEQVILNNVRSRSE